MTAPVLVPSTGKTLIAEANIVATTAIAIDANLTITDVDSTRFKSAKIAFTSGYRPGEDKLNYFEYVFTLEPYMAIRGYFDSNTGVQELSYYDAANPSFSLLTMPTLAQWQTALRSVSFSTDYEKQENPTAGDRTISFVLNDGTADSVAVTKTITITAVNDTTQLGVGHAGFALDSSIRAKDLTIFADGKIAVAGSTAIAFNNVFGEGRLLADGSPDTSFGTLGWRTTEFPNGLQRGTVAGSKVFADGSALAYGLKLDNIGASPITSAWAVARYKADGSLDSSFGVNGQLTLPYDGYTGVKDAELLPDGKILLVGARRGSTGPADYIETLIRLNANGSIDTSFGSAGVASPLGTTLKGAGLGVLVLRDGSLLTVAHAEVWGPGIYREHYYLTRLTAAGVVDTSFNAGSPVPGSIVGNLSADNSVWEMPVSMEQQADGKILVLVSESNATLVRYNENGSLDTSFNAGGSVVTGLGAFNYGAFSDAIVVQADGKILVTGQVNGNLAIVRYNSNGTLDSGFGTAGRVSTDLGGAFDIGTSLALTASGQIIVVASNEILRYSANGILDTSFGAPVSRYDSSVVINPLATMSDRELAVSGYAGSSMTLARATAANSNDKFVAKAGGTLGALTEGASLLVGTTSIGTVTKNSGGTLSLSFSAGATEALVNTAIKLIAYANTVDTAGSIVEIKWTFNDGNANGAQGPGGATQTSGLSTIVIGDKAIVVLPTTTAQVVTGGTANDNIVTGVANDSITGGGGVDSVDGGAGTDVVVFGAATSSFTIKKSGSVIFIVSKTGVEGTTYVANVESLKFADMTVNTTVQALAAAAPTADVQRLMELYVAFFNRVPDGDGMAYWLGQLSGGKSLDQIAELFYSVGVQNTAVTGYTPTMSNADFINVVYKNVLGRSEGADKAGLDYWVGRLEGGTDTKSSLVSTIIGAAHSYKGDKAYGYVADLLDNKLAVAKAFSLDMGLGYLTQDASISKGMAIAAAITPTSTTAALTLIGVTTTDIQLG